MKVIAESTGTIDVIVNLSTIASTIKVSVEQTLIDFDSNEPRFINTIVLTATENNQILFRYDQSMPIAVLDSVNVPTSPKKYMLDQAYNLLRNVQPFGLSTWTKLY